MILVTGGAGFIGSHLTRKLLEMGEEVTVIDNLWNGRKENVPDGAKFILGDVRKEDDLKKVGNVDVVFHLAAQISVPFSIENPHLDGEINIGGTINVCKVFSGAKIIYVSSAAVYGEPQYLPIDENHPTNPKAPYGLSKLTAERYIKMLSDYYNLDFSIARLFNVFGPGQSKEYAGVMAIFWERTKKGEPLIIYGDGNQTRDFVYVGDVIEALITLWKKGEKDVYNVGCGKEISINEIADAFAEKFKVEKRYEKERKGDIKRSVADISKIKGLGWKPKVDVKEWILSL